MKHEVLVVAWAVVCIVVVVALVLTPTAESKRRSSHFTAYFNTPYSLLEKTKRGTKPAKRTTSEDAQKAADSTITPFGEIEVFDRIDHHLPINQPQPSSTGELGKLTQCV